MPNKISKSRYWKKLPRLILCLFFLALIPFTDFAKMTVSANRLPVTGEVIAVNVNVDWGEVPEDNIPASLTITATPDGIPFMGSDLILNANADWQGSLAVHSGTRRVEFKSLEIEGLDHRLSGSLEEGYTISYYLQGQAPETSEPDTAEEPVEEVTLDLAAVPTKEINLKDRGITVETEEGESLSEEEYKERLLDAYMREHGYIVDKTPYYIGIAICVALIIIVIVIRVLIGRKQ